MLWDKHLQEHGQVVTVPDLYKAVELFLESLTSREELWDALRAESQAMMDALEPLVETVPAEPSMLIAQNITLDALTFGMLSGACDAHLLLAGHEVSPLLNYGFSDQDLRTAGFILSKNLGQIRQTVRENWTRAHPDDLHLLKGYAQHENAGTLQEAGQIGIKSVPSLQRFLLATFKGGYATGAVFAAVAARG